MPVAAVAALLLFAAPFDPASPYTLPTPPPDAAAQLAEMTALYDDICLKAFPNDAAVARAMAARGRAATAMTSADVRRYLHEDPGVGWFITGRSGTFELTVEAPPFHACGVRTLTAAGFPDLSSYRRLADAFESGHDVRKVGPQTFTRDNVDTTGGGESWHRIDNRDEALLVLMAQPVAAIRVPGRDGVEARFVHQIVEPSAH